MLASSPFDPLYNVIGWLLALFYRLPPHSLGISIILMTLIVMAVQFPLIAKQTRSMILMQRVQPEIKKIQQKFKEDRQKQNEELMKFYQENKINPLAGCLPMLLIIPIGFAVFGTFRHPGIQAHVPREGSMKQLYVDLCSNDQGVVLPPSVKRPFPEGKRAEDVECTAHINAHPPRAMHFLGMELNQSTAQAVQEGIGYALPWLIVLAIVIFTGWYQVRQTQARQLRQGAPVNKQMQTVTRIMPLFFGFISYGLAAAVTVYFAISNGWRIGQQHFVLNKMYEEEHPGFPSSAAKSAAKSDEKGDAKTEAKREANPGAKSAPNDATKAGQQQPARRAGAGSGGAAGGGGAAKRTGSSAARRKKKRKR